MVYWSGTLIGVFLEYWIFTLQFNRDSDITYVRTIKGCVSSHDTQLMLFLSHLLPCNLRSHCLYDVLWVELDSFLFPIASTMASWGFAHDCTRASSTFEMRFFDILIEFKVPSSGRKKSKVYANMKIYGWMHA